MKKFLGLLLSLALISGIFITTASAEVSATPTTASVIVNNRIVAFEAYNIEGSNFFKLRDLAYALQGTDKGFEVKWDDSLSRIELLPQTAYTPVGGEMEKGKSATIDVQNSTAAVYYEGKALNLAAFNINGNNFFKLRDILAVFNINVSWDASMGTIYIDSLLQKEVTVSTTAEFMAAIASNTLIRVKAGVYDFTPYNTEIYGCIISNITNLSIVGAGEDKTEFINSDRYKEIISLKNCRNISISGVKAGHTPQEYECEAGVFGFLYCMDVSVSDSYLYGCGSVGVKVDNSVNVSVDNTTITDCSYMAIVVSDSSNVVFNNCDIVKNRAFGAIIAISSYNRPAEATFNQCNISENRNIAGAMIEAWGPYKTDKISLIFNDCTIENNMCATGASPYMFELYCGNIIFNGGTIKNNIMGYEYQDLKPQYNNCDISGNVYRAA